MMHRQDATTESADKIMGMVDLKDKKNLDNGLDCLADWLKYNTESAWKNEHRLHSDHDYDFYQAVIKEARTELEEGIDIADYYEE